MKSLLQKKSIIIAVIFLLFSCFIFIFLYKIILTKKDNSISLQEKWQTEYDQRENAKSLVGLVKSVKTERELLNTHFVQSSDVVPFLNTIENIAKKVGIKAEVVSFDIPKNNSSFSVEISTSGSFDSIYKLILLLENSPYDLEFSSINMKNSNIQDLSFIKNKKVPQWTAVFKIKLLSFIN